MTATPLVADAGLRIADLAGDERRAAGRAAAGCPLAGGRRVARGRVRRRARARRRRRATALCGIHGLHPTPRATRAACSRRAAESPAWSRRPARSRCTRRASAPSAAGRPRSCSTRGRNAALIRRLAAAYEAQVVEVDGPDALLAWCRERELGLEPVVVAELLGPRDDRARPRRARAAGRARPRCGSSPWRWRSSRCSAPGSSPPTTRATAPCSGARARSTARSPSKNRRCAWSRSMTEPGGRRIRSQ